MCPQKTEVTPTWFAQTHGPPVARIFLTPNSLITPNSQRCQFCSAIRRLNNPHSRQIAVATYGEGRRIARVLLDFDWFFLSN